MAHSISRMKIRRREAVSAAASLAASLAAATNDAAEDDGSDTDVGELKTAKSSNDDTPARTSFPSATWLYLRDWEAIQRLVRRCEWDKDGGPGTRKDMLIEAQCFRNKTAKMLDKRCRFVRMLGDILLNGIEGPRGLGTVTRDEFQDAVIRCLISLRIVIPVDDMEFFTGLHGMEAIYKQWEEEDVERNLAMSAVQGAGGWDVDGS